MTDVHDAERAQMAIIGRERALVDALTRALSDVVGGPPPSRRTAEQLRRHRSGAVSETRRGSAFEVALVGPDGDYTGHVVRVTIELDHFERDLVGTR